MSVSSHLTPDPERRLRLIHENIGDSLKWTDRKLAVIVLLALLQLSFMLPPGEGSLPGLTALVSLSLVILTGLLGGSPLIETLRRIPLLEPREYKHRLGDSLVNEYDIAGYSQAELTGFLDRYLGGGVTATPYYEDIVAQIVISARIVTRKRRLFGACCALAAAAQFCLLAGRFL